MSFSEIVIVNFRFLKRPKNQSRWNQFIHRRKSLTLKAVEEE